MNVVLIISYSPAIPWDKFSFNGQARKLGTSLGAQLPSAHLEPDNCGYYCAHYVNGMNVARDSETTWVKTVHLPKKGKSGKTVQICNSKTVYDDLDDMCWNCEKDE